MVLRRRAPALQVLECWDRKRRDYVAVKIIRNIQASGCGTRFF